MNANERLSLKYMQRLVRTPEGRAFLLTQVAEAEGSDEGAIFDHLLANVDDPELRRLVKRHADDEIRHAAMFRARAEAQGVGVPTLPESIKLLPRLSRRLGGVLERGIHGREDVMNAYVLLQVIEERAASRFPLIEAAFRPVDPVSADTFREIAKDEERHLKYCHAIARRYAPDQATYEARVRFYRDAEALAFAENGRANMEYTIGKGYPGFGPLRALVWRSLVQLATRAGAKPRTRYWDEPLPRAGKKLEAELAAAA